MKILNKIEVTSLPIQLSTLDLLCPEGECSLEERERLSKLFELLGKSGSPTHEPYVCLVEEQAKNDFLNHANEVYWRARHEATGIFLGYYLHHPNAPEEKIAVATEFLPAQGNTSSATCEISYEDSARFALYAQQHHMVPVLWPHTHPFKAALFYSPVDIKTLKAQYSSPHQMGVVCNNLDNSYMGFKVINGELQEYNLYAFNLNLSMESGKLVWTTLYNKNPQVRIGKAQVKLGTQNDNQELKKETLRLLWLVVFGVYAILFMLFFQFHSEDLITFIKNIL